MNRKLVLLNLALLTLVASLAWLLRARWIEEQVHERAIFEQAVRAKALLPPPPPPALKPATPAEYIDVAQKMLFSKDRNPTVVVEVPPPKPDPPVPPLPQYHGQMAIGDPVVFLSIDSKGDQKSYRAGEKVGPFELVKFDRDQITLAWGGKTIERKLRDLAPKEEAAAQTKAAAAAATPASSGPVALGSATNLAADKKDSVLGTDTGAGNFTCVAGDTSPAGTVKDGYKKNITHGMFGEVCFWEKVK